MITIANIPEKRNYDNDRNIPQEKFVKCENKFEKKVVNFRTRPRRNN